MKESCKKGGCGCGHAQQALFELTVEKFLNEQELHNQFMNDKASLDSKLAIVADKAGKVIHSQEVPPRVEI